MIGRYTEIHKSQIKQCRECGRDICFVQNRNDKWFTVDVVYPQRRPAYKHSAGAYGNMIPWHHCPPKRDYLGEQLVTQASRLAVTIALRGRDRHRENPVQWESDPIQVRLESLQIKLQQRIARRIAALPEASKAYIR